jgi:DNA-binding GntR family transcriptional regulator
MTAGGRLAMEDNRIKPLTLRHQVCDRIRTRVLSGALAPGDQLVEVSLATELGVSRGSVREALRDLEAEHLVRTIPYRGTYVIDLSPAEARELYEVIRSVEHMALQFALDHADEQLGSRLEQPLALMRKACDEKDLYALARADMQFHEVVFRVADNQYLMRVWKSLLPSVFLFVVKYLDVVYSSWNEFVEHHGRLAELLVTKDRSLLKQYTRKRHEKASRSLDLESA